MKVLSIKQPFAGLIALGYKTIETRGWATSYTGELLIHSTKVADVDAIDKLETFREQHPELTFDDTVFECGVLLAKATLSSVITQDLVDFPYSQNTDPSVKTLVDIELEFGYWHTGHFAWLLKDVVRLPHPIAVKGKLGLWDYEGVV